MCVWASFSAIPKRNFTHCAINDVSCQFPANNFQWRLAVVSTRSITISLCLGLSVCVCSGVNRSQCHSGGANTHTHTSNTTKLWAGGDMLLLRLWIFCGNTSDVAKKKSVSHWKCTGQYVDEVDSYTEDFAGLSRSVCARRSFKSGVASSKRGAIVFNGQKR